MIIADEEATEALRQRVLDRALNSRTMDVFKNWKAVLFDVEREAEAQEWLIENTKHPWMIEHVSDTYGFNIPSRRACFRSPKDAALFRLFFV